MSGIVKGVLGLIGLGGGTKECETAKRALELHNGQVTVGVDSENMQVVFQVDEKADAQPVIIDLLNNVIQKVTVVAPANSRAAADVPVTASDLRNLQAQVTELHQQFRSFLAQKDESTPTGD
jgi:hypothetical protein